MIDKRRLKQIESGAPLSKRELADGYLICVCEWDGAVINRQDPEFEFCHCYSGGIRPDDD